MDNLWSLLPFAALLACPLMMVACMAGMRRQGRSDQTHSAGATEQERYADMEQRLANLQSELNALKAESARPAELEPAGRRVIARART